MSVQWIEQILNEETSDLIQRFFKVGFFIAGFFPLFAGENLAFAAPGLYLKQEIIEIQREEAQVEQEIHNLEVRRKDFDHQIKSIHENIKTLAVYPNVSCFQDACR